MFEHANRHDFIEMPGLLAIIPQREGDAVTGCCCLQILTGIGQLLFRQGDAGDMYIWLAFYHCCGQTAAAGAGVQYSVTWLQI